MGEESHNGSDARWGGGAVGPKQQKYIVYRPTLQDQAEGKVEDSKAATETVVRTKVTPGGPRPLEEDLMAENTD